MNRKRVTTITAGDIIYCEEDVFIKKHNKLVFAGKRVMVVQVIEQKVKGELICKIMKSAGTNALPVGIKISRPSANLKRGWQLTDITFDDEKLKSGGYLEGTQNGKKVQMADASKGGMSVGAKHTDGGIKGTVGSQEKPIEFEGEEIILTAPVASNPEKYEFEGKEMTGIEIASHINEKNGGVAIAASGGQASKIKCCGKTFNFGGMVISDKDIFNYINFMNKPVQERILHLKK